MNKEYDINKELKSLSEELKLKGERLEALINLSSNIREKEKRVPIPIDNFLHLMARKPYVVLRNIFQLFNDMVHHYVPEGIDEYSGDKYSIGYSHYDMSRLLNDNCDVPFFADRLFANRFMNLVKSFRKGIYNQICLFEGPPGSGKSTFLNNILTKMEEYSKSPRGSVYETYWLLDVSKFRSVSRYYSRIRESLQEIDDHDITEHLEMIKGEDKIGFSCPNHDHPILQIPKIYRKRFLEELVEDKEMLNTILEKKEYEWVLRDTPCHICTSLFNNLMDELGDPLEVFKMIQARRMKFSRQFGEGITVYNPGDRLFDKPIGNTILQRKINSLLNNENIKIIYSDLAKTNNGIYALMDIKDNNVQRLMNLHGIISDGVHRVHLVEERINSLFLGLINPADKSHYEKVPSFKDRIITVNIPYILDYKTEMEILLDKFGDHHKDKFMPHIFESFARAIISTRLNYESPSIKKWISKPDVYKSFVDKTFLMLKMDIYSGVIPGWLTDEDLSKFDKDIRKSLLAEAETEGVRGVSGRQSLKIYNKFISKYEKKETQINIDSIVEFFSDKDNLSSQIIPSGFLESLVDMYDFLILGEVKSAIYYYNEKQIDDDIKEYLYAINFDIGNTHINPYTNRKIVVSEEFYKNFEAIFVGTTAKDVDRKNFRDATLNEYITSTLSKEIMLEKKKIEDTGLFKSIKSRYNKSLKENALAPYVDNDNFRRALVDFYTPEFESYDTRLKKDIKFMLGNLINIFGYTEESAVFITLYALDKKLDKKF
ncbi:MAG: serine protein kinase PrkA [Candidatus Delongbacteria bacterium]|nr:serine protein kinase PrkA [Candidatus Delongbacteria bacterium]MBN2834822.1 serine protein kinase PrkA [Candidatus Delongbacteria bacterium]